MSRFESLFQTTERKVLSVFCTAGFPYRESTIPVAKALVSAGVDFLEIGMPYSDPLADGPTIQRASSRSLRNGTILEEIFCSIETLRRDGVECPLVLMGYVNPIFQYGIERFFSRCAEVGIDGCILPDLPLEEYQRHLKRTMEHFGQQIIFLVSSVTPEARVRELDRESGGFLYVVSSPSVTGNKDSVAEMNEGFLESIGGLGLKSPLMVGFGIRDRASFEKATRFARGGIIGSAFIEMLESVSQDQTEKRIQEFVENIQGAR